MDPFISVKRTGRIILIVATVIFIFWIGFWYGLNNYVIPKVLIPEIRKEIRTFNKTSPVKISVGNIHFDFFQGFHVEDLSISNIATAESVDIDIDFFALLRRQVAIKEINVFYADLNLVRDRRGMWSFDPLLKMGFMEGKQGRGAFSVVIGKITFEDGRLLFADHFNPRNALVREFCNINLSVVNADGNKYKIEFSGTDGDKSESLRFNIDYDDADRSVRGEIDFNTPHLADYWDYYLDDILKPWRLAAKKAEAKVKFALGPDELTLDGWFGLDGAVVPYGDISFSGNARLKHKQKVYFKKPAKSYLRAELKLDQFAFSIEAENVFRQAKASAVMNEKEITFKRFSGLMGDSSFDLSGRYIFGFLNLLELKGNIDDVSNEFKLKIISENQAVGNWKISSEAVTLKLYADVTDLKKMAFNASVEGRVSLEKMPSQVSVKITEEKKVSIEASGHDIAGTVDLAGRIAGQVGDWTSLNGLLGLKLNDFSVLAFPPVSFSLGMKLADGVFFAGIPTTKYFNGMLSGGVIMDSNNWGVELQIDKCDIAQLGMADPRFKGMKGIITANLACVSSWNGLASLEGGGYVDIANCDFRDAPIFEAVAKGIASVSHGFVLSAFKKIEGNFALQDESVALNDAVCEAESFSFIVNGKCYFSGNTDLTIGVRFFKKGFWNTMRLIFIPVSIGIDIVADSIKVKVAGLWPDFQATASVQPMSWFNTAFGNIKYDPNRYDLKKLWDERR